MENARIIKLKNQLRSHFDINYVLATFGGEVWENNNYGEEFGISLPEFIEYFIEAMTESDDDNSDEDKDTDEDTDDDEEYPDRCVKCDRKFNQRKLLNDYDCAKAWELHCDIGDDEGDLCCACLQKWEDERCYMCNSGEHFVPKEMMWPNHTDCVFCAEPEYAEE